MMDISPTVWIIGKTIVRDRILKSIAACGVRLRLFSTATEFLSQIDRQSPGLLIADYSARLPSGKAVHDELLSQEQCPPIVLTIGGNNVETLVHAKRLGVFDFVAYSDSEETIRQVIESGISAAALSHRQYTQRADASTIFATLTALERDVLRLLLRGTPNKAVGAQLGCSRRTVEHCRARIMQKSAASSFAEMVKFSVLAGVQLDPVDLGDRFDRAPSRPAAAKCSVARFG